MKASISIFTVLFLALAAEMPAQQKAPKPPSPQDQRISLKGFMAEGGIANIITGEAHYLNQKGGPQKLKPQHQFDMGDELQVGPNGYVEILLNPGSYLRLSPNSRLRFFDLSPDNLKLQLLNGSMILESFVAPRGVYEHANAKQNPNDLRASFDGGYQGIDVITSQGDFMVARGGLYRCDLDAEGRASLKVLKGVAVIPHDVLSDGMSTTLGDRVPTIQNFDVTREDDFDVWSHHRAMALVDANQSLRDTPWGKQLRKNDMTYLNIEYDESHTRMKEALTVSALGGWVAFAEPGAEYQTPETSWQPLTSEVELKAGVRVRTNASAHAEIHLYPECYLFLDHNTEIVYGARPDAGVAVKLISGSAMLISSLKRKDGVLTSLMAAGGEIEIPEEGVYRLNVRSPRQAELVIYRGRATIQGQVLEHNQRTLVSGSKFETDSIRWMDIDPFELWSRKRSHLLILSMALENTRMKLENIDNKHRRAIVPGSAHRVESTGMWYLTPETDVYTFVPALRNSSSPYGPKYEFWFRTE